MKDKLILIPLILFIITSVIINVGQSEQLEDLQSQLNVQMKYNEQTYEWLTRVSKNLYDFENETDQDWDDLEDYFIDPVEEELKLYQKMYTDFSKLQETHRLYGYVRVTNQGNEATAYFEDGLLVFIDICYYQEECDRTYNNGQDQSIWYTWDEADIEKDLRSEIE